MGIRRLAAGLAVFWLLVAASPDLALRDGGAALVTQVIDGDTLELDDGRRVRLVGIQAAEVAHSGDPAEPWAAEATFALEMVTLGKRVRLSYGGLEIDRYGRVLAHLHTEDGVWVQAEMLRQGMVRVYSFADNRTLVPEMLAIEAEARAGRRGLWALAEYSVLDQQDTWRHLNRFAIVEGVVLATDEMGGRVYLNFGPDWRTDFTVSIAPGDVRIFRDAGVEPLAYAGQRIRVRGWLRNFNGPMIDATHPEQIESAGR